MAISLFLTQLFFWTSLLSCLSFADQIVYLDRAADLPVGRGEPVFDPQSVIANVGEQIHFVARFGDQRPFRPGV
jgi:hypothetical protein